MKNVNIFVDVDLTLVDGKGQLVEGAREALERLKDKGCHLYLWSNAGKDYAQGVANRYHLAHLFEGCIPKPDIVIDDMPATALNPIVLDPNYEPSWSAISAQIVEKHLD